MKLKTLKTIERLLENRIEDIEKDYEKAKKELNRCYDETGDDWRMKDNELHPVTMQCRMIEKIFGETLSDLREALEDLINTDWR